MPKLQDIKTMLVPYRDVILFMVTMFAANYFWKLTIDAEEWGGTVLWFGWDISYPFDVMCEHIAAAVCCLVSLFRDTVSMADPVTVQFTSGSSVRIVWGCTAIKQSFIWLMIMLFARGSWGRKLWFIPLGWAVCYVFNIFRIFIITLVVEHYMEYFEVLHTYVFKYLFYGILFLLWVWWVERVGQVHPKNEANG